MKKIAISTTSFAEFDNTPLELCNKKGFKVAINPYRRKVSSEELIKIAQDAMGLIAGIESISEEVLLKLPKLKVISRCGAGLENIDLNAAKKLGIEVFNTADAPTLAVAELTVGLILNLLRKVNQMDAALKNGKWQKLMGNIIYGKRIGIIGFGRIGKKVAELLQPFNCEIAYADPFVENGLLGLRQLPKEDLLRWADIITLHVSTKEQILGEKDLRLIKKGAWLINVSRGEIIDTPALYRYLKNGHVAGVALDVFEQEPYNGPLKDFDNVILTPHIGSYAEEIRIKMEIEAVENLFKGLKEG